MPSSAKSRMTKSVVKLIAGFIILIVFAYESTRAYKFSHYEEWLLRVNRGDNEKMVLEHMGRPDEIVEDPSKSILSCNSKDEHKVFAYGRSFPPEWWVVGFNSHGEVICTAHLQSP